MERQAESNGKSALRRTLSIEGMTIDQLLAEKLVLDGENAAIKSQLEAAMARAIADGVYADPDWFSRARHAQRMYGRRSQEIQVQIARLRREDKARNRQDSSTATDRFRWAFMRLVRERLGDVEYRDICERATAESGEE